MRLKEAVIVFMLTCNIMIILSLPVWWESVSPYIFGAPEYIETIISRADEAINFLLDEISKK